MTDFVYVPVLRWKQGEQGALRNLDPADRHRMLPIAEIQQLEPGVAQPKLERQMIRSAGKQYPIGIDLAETVEGRVPHSFLADRCRRLQAAGVIAWPTIHASHAIANLAGLTQFKGQPAVIVRSRAGIALAGLTGVVNELRKACGKATKIYVVLDMFAVGAEDPSTQAAVLAPSAKALIAHAAVEQVAACGGSFPISLAGFKAGVNNKSARRELAVWNALRVKPGCDEVVFGDYCVTNPAPLEEIDPTKINPAAAIRYTLKDHWWVLRGSGVRTKGKGGMGQYNDLCKLLIVHPDYSGKPFSYGDGQYHAHAQPGSGSGNLSTWRRDATSHHLVFTVRQLVAGNV